jgi:chitodextrinase
MELLPLNYKFRVSYGGASYEKYQNVSGDPLVFFKFPVAISGGPYSALVGESITFDGSQSYDVDGNVVSYKWDFGDGNIADVVKPSYSYSLPGEYTVLLTVSDDLGATNTAVTTAYINSPPVADGSGPAPYTAYKNTPVILYCDESYDTDGIIVMYEWDFDGDGSYDWNSTIPTTVEHTYTTDGSHLPVLRVTDDKGGSDTVTALVTIEYFWDDFNDNVLDLTKWSMDITGSGNQYQEINEEGKFAVVRSGHTWLISQIVTIENWDTITIEGKWKFSSPLSRPTPEMTLYLYDADTNQLNGIAYDNWNSIIRYWYTNVNYLQDTRTSPKTYVTFKVVVTKTSMEYWENGVKLREITTSALASTTNFKLKIGGWDASSISNQYVYFDDIQINAS